MDDIIAGRVDLQNMLLNMEYCPVDIPRHQLQEKGYTEVPLTELSTMGAAFSSLVQSFNTVTTTVTSGETLLRPVNMAISEMFQTDSGLLRGFSHDGSQFTKNGLFEKVNGTEVIKTTTAYNPAMLFIAAAIAGINQKLDDIKNTQEKILFRFEKRDKAELQGDLNVLLEVLDQYKYYCTNHVIKYQKLGLISHIKKDAIQKIAFYQDTLTDDFFKKSFIRFNKDINKVAAELLDYFKFYQLSVYEYAFASFMEIMLSEHFDKAYLESINKWINDYALKYRMTYSDFYDVLDKYTQSSVEAKVLGGIAKIGKAAGETIGKLPIADKITIDDKLIEKGEKLEDFSLKQASEVMILYRDLRDCGTKAFVENIEMISRLYNKPMDVLFDKENLYINLAA